MLTNICICIGIFFILIASIGIIRMPDVLTRMSVVSKAITLGVGFILLGIVVHFNDTSTFIKAAVIYLFLSLSTSIASTVIGLSAYKDKKTQLSKLTFLDEMGDKNKSEDQQEKPDKNQF